MNESLFTQAVSLARSGRKAEARDLLQQIIKADRTNEMAWLWYAECVETPAERRHALESCMRLNPQAQRVRLSLMAMRQTGALANDMGLTQPVFIGLGQQDSDAQGAVAQGAFVSDSAASEADAQAVVAKTVRALSNEDQWVLSAESNVFTVSPEHIPAEEFARVEERTEAFLLKNPDLKPVWERSNGKAAQGKAQPIVLAERSPQVTPRVSSAAKKSKSKSRGAVFTLLLVTLMFALLVSAAIMLQVV